MTLEAAGAAEIADAVRARRVTAEKIAETTLARIAKRDPERPSIASPRLSA